MKTYFQYSFFLSLVLFALPHLAAAASLFLSPATGVYQAGATFQVSVLLDTEGAAVNAAEGTLSFVPGELKVLNVSNSGSIFNLWAIDPTFSNSAGSIDFGGGSPKGYKGNAGKVVTITFQAMRAATARVRFSSGAALAADGQGTNVIAGMREGAYTLQAKTDAPNPEYVAPSNTPGALVVVSSTHPDAAAWYPLNTAKLSWVVPEGITELRTLLDERSGTIPTKNYPSPFSEKTIDALPEGESYFHIQAKNKFGWGKVTNVRLGVDTEKPTEFKMSEAPAGADGARGSLLLSAADKTSGIAQYEFVIDDAAPVIQKEKGEKRFELPVLLPGRHTIVAKVFDRAGNYLVDSVSVVVAALDAPRFTEYPSVVAAGSIIVAKGVSFPGARLTVTLRRGAQVVATSTVIAAADSSFTYVAPDTVSVGSYTLVAEAADAHGGRSTSSDPITIAVRESGMVRIGSFVVSVLSILIPLVALVLVLLFLLLYGRHRISTLRRRLRKEVSEAETAVKVAFAELRREAVKNVKLLEKVADRRALTTEEKDVLESLKGRLDSIEAKVEKEIEDVERVLSEK